MPKEVMRRSASDNAYLHKDFHGALSAGIEYVYQKYGAEAVRKYLRQFASSFYTPLKADVQRRGLVAFKDGEKLPLRNGCPAGHSFSQSARRIDWAELVVRTAAGVMVAVFGQGTGQSLPGLVGSG